MKVSEILSIVSTIAGAFIPGASAIEDIITAMKNHQSPDVQSLGALTESLAAMPPETELTVEEIEIERLKLNDPLVPDPQ